MHSIKQIEQQFTPSMDVMTSFRKSVVASPHKEALYSDGKSYTYQQIDDLSSRLASYLRNDLKIQSQERIGIYLKKNLCLCIALLAVLKAECVYVPLDPSYPDDRLRLMAQKSEVALILSQEELPLSLSHNRTFLISNNIFKELPPSLSDKHPFFNPNDLAYLLFTSGSTGEPKGVMVTRGNLGHFIEAMGHILHCTPQDRMYSVTPISFDIFGLEFFLPLCWESTLIFPHPTLQGNVVGMWEELSRLQTTIFQATPVFYHLACEESTAKNTALRHVLCGGEKWDITLAEKIRTVVQDSCHIWNMYGPTETTIWSLYKEITPDQTKILLERPIGNTLFYIFDDNLKICDEGELYLGGSGVTAGYWQNKTLTQKNFIIHPETKERLYRTGDLVRRTSEGILYLNRMDEQIKWRGFRIELGDIEENLAKITGVNRAIVGIIEEADRQKLVCFLKSTQEIFEDIDNLRKALLEILPSYMCPEEFVKVNSFPLTPNGKVDRKSLYQAYLSRNPTFNLPNEGIVEKLGKLWKEILQVEAITAEDHFFKRGGHSLMIARLLSRIRREFQISLRMDDLFQHLVFSHQVDLIQERLSKEGEEIKTQDLPVRISQTSRIPATYAQKAEYATSLTPNARAVHLPSTWRIYGKLDLLLLEKAFHHVINSHDSLRTGFENQNGVLYQVIHQDVPFSINLLKRPDLCTLTGQNFDKALEDLFREDESWVFEMAKPPLIRLTIVEISSTDYLILLTLHHAITDGWSKALMLEQISKAYQQLVETGQISQPVPSKQYGNFVRWQEDYLESLEYLEHTSFWQQRLSQYKNFPLPGDLKEKGRQSFVGEVIYKKVAIPDNVLKKISEFYGVTPFSFLNTVFYGILSKLCNFTQKRFVVSTDVACRSEEGFESILGLVMNTTLIDYELNLKACFADNLKGMQDSLYQTLNTQSLPFERLLEDLKKNSIITDQLGEVQIIFQNIPPRKWILKDLTTIKIKRYPQMSGLSFILELTIDEQGNLEIACEYSSELYSREFIETLLTHYQNILVKSLQSPTQELEKLLRDI